MKTCILKIIAVILIVLFSAFIISCRTADNAHISGSSDSRIINAADKPEIPVSDSSASDKSEKNEIDFKISATHLNLLLKNGIKYKESLFFPVHRRGKIRYIEENLDNKGESEFYILYAFGESSEITEEQYLSDKRNYLDESLSEKYFIAVYKPYSGKLRFTEIIPVKSRPLLKYFSVVKLSANTSEKAVSISFTGEDGIYQNLITVSPKEEYSVFSMNNTLTEFNRIEDIDRDRSLEILRYENLFEEGLGYETFVSLFEYKDGRFYSDGSLSIVRTLKSFLSEAEQTLENKNIAEFLNISVPENKLRKLRSRGLSNNIIIRKIFYPVKKENELFPDINVFMKNGVKIDFVFPDIVENPFRFDRENIYNFTSYVRVSSESMEEAIYIVKIYMNSNPFESPRFSFHVN